MKYALEINANVEIDINEAREYYEQRDTGLGRRFAEEVYTTMQSLEDNPLMFQKRYGEYRMVTTKRFSYKVIYRVYKTYVSIVAVQHPGRHPMFWKQRI